MKPHITVLTRALIVLMFLCAFVGCSDDALRPAAALEGKVTNVWNNRLVSDQFLPEEKRITRTNLQGQHTKNSPLVPSGLLGPVTLQPVKQN